MRKYITIPDRQPNPWDVHRDDVEVNDEALDEYGCPDLNACLDNAFNEAVSAVLGGKMLEKENTL